MSEEPFAEWFNKQLLRREWSPAEFIRRSELPRSTVYSWTRGERVPSIDHIGVIADVMLVDADALLMLTGQRLSAVDVDPDSNLAEILGLVKAVNWEDDEDRMDFIVPVLRRWAERDRKQSANEQE